MTVINLDRKSIAKLPEGEGLYWDQLLKGFGYLCRQDAGGVIRRSFIIQYRHGGKQRKLKLGDAAKINVDQARKLAEKQFAQITLGNDPAAEKDAARAAKSVMKFSDAAELFLKFKAEKLRPSSLRMVTLYLTSAHYFPTFHKKPLDQITLGDVSRRLDALKRESASRARVHLNSFFAWCLTRGYCSQNPVINADAYEQGPGRTRFLNDDELRAVWNSCDMTTDFGKIVRLLLLTGCRCQEIGGLKWSEVDLSAGTITLPADRTKNNQEHMLTLPRLAMDIIRSVPQRVGNDHVFGERGNGFNSWQYAKGKLEDGIAVEWRLHDLRRTMATKMAESPEDGGLGIQPYIIEAVLNHVSGHKAGVAGIYNRASYKSEMKDALLRWADHIAKIVGINVVQLRSA
jgi:integrase